MTTEKKNGSFICIRSYMALKIIAPQQYTTTYMKIGDPIMS